MPAVRRRRGWSWKKKAAVVLGGGFGLVILVLATGYVVTAIPKPSREATGEATIIQYAGGQ